MIESLHLQESVRLIGPIYDQDKLAALAATDLFVLPSLSESFGNAAAEAVAAGVPVLLTDTCGIAPMIHERAGLAVPLGMASLAAGLRTMMNDAEHKNSASEATSSGLPMRPIGCVFASLSYISFSRPG